MPNRRRATGASTPPPTQQDLEHRISKSISVDPDLFAVLEKRRGRMRMSRSEFVTRLFVTYLLSDDQDLRISPETDDRLQKLIKEELKK